MPETTILVVDDEQTVLHFVVPTLRKAGYSVISASSGLEALAACREREGIDLAVLDVIMPGMNGPQLLTRLREQFGSVRVLFMSGYSNSRAVAIPRRTEEASIFMEKPFTGAKLLARVEEALAARSKSYRQVGQD
jgi:two-component system cell cycle sensor histidine kinase/response regulator CckA